MATIGQFGVQPGRQGAGTGTRLLQEAERLAVASVVTELALDTSEGAGYLIDWYERDGFRVVEHAQWQGKTYRGVIMSKPVCAPDLISAETVGKGHGRVERRRSTGLRPGRSCMMSLPALRPGCDEG